MCSDEKPSSSKKKKSSAKASNTSGALDPDDVAALNRRAERFQREHEIERMKSMRGATNHHSRLLDRVNNNSRSASPSTFGGYNDGADQVRYMCCC